MIKTSTPLSDKKDLENLTYSFIQSQEEFEKCIDAILAELEEFSYIAVDTEFERRTSYYPELCLLQIALPSRRTFLIDPFNIKNFEPLRQILEDNKITKIFHSSSQDIEILINLFCDTPKRIFDTQIAAKYCHLDEDRDPEIPFEISYGHVVNWLCDTQLDKSSQKTDWTKRPLAEEHLLYASADVIYLLGVYEKLVEKLHLNDQYDRAIQDFTYLSDRKSYEKSIETIFDTFSKRDISREANPLLLCFLQWREDYAKKKNKPRQHILRDDTIREIILSEKTHSAILSILKKARKSALMRDIKDILEKIPFDESVNEGETHTRSLEEREKLKMAIEEAKQLRTEIADKLKLDPRLIASNKDLELYIRGKTGKDFIFITGWRKKEFGEKLKKLQQG